MLTTFATTTTADARARVRRHRALRRLAAAMGVAVAVFGVAAAPSAGDLQSRIAAARSAAAALHQQIAADSAQIAATGAGLAQARSRLADIQADLDRRESQLRAVHAELLAARNRLVDLENRLHAATTALAANLVAAYEGGRPNLTAVVVDAHGFDDLLNQVSFMQRIANQNATILHVTRIARAEVAREADRLQVLEARDQALTDEVLAQRNQEAALKAALVRRQLAEISARSSAGARYGAVRAQLQTLQAQLNAIEARAAAQAAAAARAGSAPVGGIAVDSAGMVQPPAGAPEAVRQVIAAANAIATLPYIYGGGHGSFHADGYDCSGSVSYALAAAGLVSSPMVSGDFASWGAPGPGRWITVYANAGHVWMEVAGWRFDTVAQGYSGTRWAQGGGEFDGFAVRHPPGL